MSLSFNHLLALLHDTYYQARLRQAVEHLPAGRVLQIEESGGSARIVALAALLAGLDIPVLIVTSRQDSAEQLAGTLAEYLSDDRAPALWPVPEGMPYEQFPLDREASAQRVELMSRLLQAGPATVVAPARALTQLLSQPTAVKAESWNLRVGQQIRPDVLMSSLLDVGYDLLPLAQGPGQVSRRGGIIDVCPPSADTGIRIDLFGDEIESLRLFDLGTQRTTGRAESFQISPPLEVSLRGRDAAVAALAELDRATLRPEVREEWERNLQRLERGEVSAALDVFAPYLLGEPASLLDYLPSQHLLVLIEPNSIRLSLQQIEAQAEELRNTFEEAGELPLRLKRPYHAWDAIAPRLASTRQLAFGALPTGWAPPTAAVFDAVPSVTSSVPTYAGRLDELVSDLQRLLAENWRVVLATEQSRRTAELLEEHDVFPRLRTEPPGGTLAMVAPPAEGTVEVVHSRLDGGWQEHDHRVLLLTDRELYGYHRVAHQPARRPRTTMTPRIIERLSPGQYVVHIEHGIARYEGLVKLDVSGVEREYLLLEYAEGDRLYLPVDQFDRITLYEGGGSDPKLTRLGSPEWSRVKGRVRRAVREMAFELLQLYAAREAAAGYTFPPDTPWDRELEESFPYVETPDQQRAIQEVKVDLEQVRPTDRLICGDVGYGKTEVALRAAFKAVNAGFQVAILVPTTVLALQHYQTFRNRLAPFPVRVDMLSRLRPAQEQAAIAQRLRDGTTDIVIGTHRLLQKDVQIRRLGLVVIDEEQRFGVAHKEQLKRLRTDVDVITMTATPIPRTLHMALAGIRDLSVINTAPRDRAPIRTFVTPTSDATIREAILRELGRGGQVYVVHNRVQSIYHVLNRLRRLVPEARFAVGHGQMDEEELEQVMLGFVEHEFDVLLCTTIIESGVDIPNVNTIIIDQAQTLGLTQLYQLRGRVGRSHHRAYAYLLYDGNRPLSTEAIARLEAIQEATELGSGFQIALRDLEIRGAGNLLGAEQSGHIAAVGFDLYTRMLALAVEEIKQGRPIEEPEAVTVDLPIEAVIPDSYTGDEQIRIDLYRKLAAVRGIRELRDIQEELTDRFGPLPTSVQRLIDLTHLRIRASDLGITSIVERDNEVYIRPVLGSRLNQTALRRQVGDGVRVTPNQVRLSLNRISVDVWDAVQTVVREIEMADATVLAAAS